MSTNDLVVHTEAQTRYAALRLAIDNMDNQNAANIVADAEQFRKFLTGESANDTGEADMLGGTGSPRLG